MADDPTGHAEWVLREWQHRMKNMAAVIRSLARRTVETSDTLEEFQSRFDGRLGALIRAHSALSRSELGEANLEEIVRDTLQEQAPGATNWSVEGAEVWLPSSLTDSLALLFHELAVEAVEGGALGGSDGRLSVSWTVEATDGAGRQLVLDWRETGLTTRAAPRDFEFASELLDRALAYQFGGETQDLAGPEGLRWILRLPLGEARS